MLIRAGSYQSSKKDKIYTKPNKQSLKILFIWNSIFFKDSTYNSGLWAWGLVPTKFWQPPDSVHRILMSPLTFESHWRACFSMLFGSFLCKFGRSKLQPSQPHMFHRDCAYTVPCRQGNWWELIENASVQAYLRYCTVVHSNILSIGNRLRQFLGDLYSSWIRGFGGWQFFYRGNKTFGFNSIKFKYQN